MGSGQSAFQGWDENTASYSRIIMNENDPIAWENIIRKCIEDELYASSKLEVGIVLYLYVKVSRCACMNILNEAWMLLFFCCKI